jgi:hypothetical protein
MQQASDAIALSCGFPQNSIIFLAIVRFFRVIGKSCPKNHLEASFRSQHGKISPSR